MSSRTRRLAVLFFTLLLAEKAVAAEPWSFDFQDIGVRQVLHLLAEMRGLNLVVGEEVSGRITLRMQDMSWERALELVLESQGLRQRRDGKLLVITRAHNLAKGNSPALPVMDYLRIRYAEATHIADLLGKVEGRGPITVDPRTNALLLGGDRAQREHMRSLIKKLDIPVRQVLIEALIVLARSDFAEQLGLEWRGEIGELEDVPNSRLNTASNGSLSVTLDVGFASNHALLRMRLAAMESSGMGEVLSRPRLIASNRQTASIKSGTQIPFQESAPNGRTTVKFKDAVLKLDVTPVITPGDKIVLDLVINQDSPGSAIEGADGQTPTINTTELRTRVLLGEDETVALGGVFRDEDVRSQAKTPILGDVPLMGKFFQRKSVNRVKTETLIFITPRILPGE